MQNCTIKYLVLIISILSAAAGPFVYAGEKKITPEWIYNDECKEISAVPKHLWLDDGTALLYDTRKPEDARTIEKLNPESGKRWAVLDMKKALQSLQAFLAEEDMPEVLDWPEEFDKSGKLALYIFDDDIYLLNLAEASFHRVTKTEEEEKCVHFSPDGKKISFVRSNDLYVYDIESQTEKAITSDGSETILNGTLSWVYWEEIFGRKDIGYWWSDDSNSIAYLRTDESPVGVMHFVDFSPYTPRVITQRYPKPGATNPIVHLYIADVNSGQAIRLDPSEIPYEYIVRVKWLPDNEKISVQTLNRNQTKLDLYFVDRITGRPTHILTETDPGWLDMSDDLYFLEDDEHFIWASQRDGYWHLYSYTMDGKLVNQITKGDWALCLSGAGPSWVLKSVAAIDEENQWIYFASLKESSIERHLYRIKFDGSQMQRLSQEPGCHRISFSPNAKYYFDNYSNISTLPRLCLHSSDSKLVSVLAEPRPELLEDFDIQFPTLFTVPAEDGFAMPAALLKPKDFDPQKKYPVIINVYGGPAAPMISDSWKSGIFSDQLLLDNGYLVFRADNRSATAISKKLTNLITRQMWAECELNDLLAAVKWLKAQSYVDPNRIGIYGWSGGGSFTLLAVTHSKEFKAAIAGAPVTDWRYYNAIFAERGMKRPQDNPDGYEKTSLVKHAEDLHSRLLIIHGTYDDNVHPQNTFSFVNELIEAGKTFDMMIYPMRKHSFSDKPAKIHRLKTMIEFWNKNL